MLRRLPSRRLLGVTTLLAIAIASACSGDEGELDSFTVRDPICAAGAEEPCLCGEAMRTRICENGEWGECRCAPTECGNAAVEVGEECDGENLNSETCESVTMGAAPTGTLACTSECAFDTSGCTPFGNMGGGGTFGQGGSFGQGGLFGQGGGLFGQGGLGL